MMFEEPNWQGLAPGEEALRKARCLSTWPASPPMMSSSSRQTGSSSLTPMLIKIATPLTPDSNSRSRRQSGLRRCWRRSHSAGSHPAATVSGETGKNVDQTGNLEGWGRAHLHLSRKQSTRRQAPQGANWKRMLTKVASPS